MGKKHYCLKQGYITPPVPYFIVLASSVKILEVKAIEFHRIKTRWNFHLVADFLQSTIDLPALLLTVKTATDPHETCASGTSML